MVRDTPSLKDRLALFEQKKSQDDDRKKSDSTVVSIPPRKKLASHLTEVRLTKKQKLKMPRIFDQRRSGASPVRNNATRLQGLAEKLVAAQQSATGVPDSRNNLVCVIPLPICAC
jgi:hypothetical protein